MKTLTANPDNIERKWYVIDAEGVVLGRLASKAASLLMGKNKPIFSTSHDMGDHIIIINAEKVALTGNKRETKVYFTHSTYSGGGRTLSFEQSQILDAGNPIRAAIKGMLPKNSRGRQMFRKLFVYGGTVHPHSAQQPQTLSV